MTGEMASQHMIEELYIIILEMHKLSWEELSEYAHHCLT